MKPVKCKVCSKRFTDACSLNKYTAKNECNQVVTQLILHTLTIYQLRNELKAHEKSVIGSKKDLIRQLEGSM